MATAIVRKVFEDQDKPGPGLPFYISNLDKLLLKVFNKLLHNCEVSRLLVARFSLDLPDHYTPDAPVKLINIFVLKEKFLLLISKQNLNTTNDVLHVNGCKVPAYSMFKYYSYGDLWFLKLSLYKYYGVILVIKGERK